MADPKPHKSRSRDLLEYFAGAVVVVAYGLMVLAVFVLDVGDEGKSETRERWGDILLALTAREIGGLVFNRFTNNGN